MVKQNIVFVENTPGRLQKVTKILAENQIDIYGFGCFDEMCIRDRMKVYPQLLRNVRVSDKKTALENEKVKAAIEAAAEALGDDGRILVRESGTEPVSYTHLYYYHNHIS